MASIVESKSDKHPSKEILNSITGSWLGEVKELVVLALPVSLAQLSMVGMTATDVIIAGNASTVELAGMNLGANTWNMIILFFMGIGFATQPLVANQFGAQSDQGVRIQLQQSLWLCLFLGGFATVFVVASAFLLLLVPFEQSIRGVAHAYLLAIATCALPTSLIPAARGTLEGMSMTRTVFAITFAAFLLNIPLDYILVYGLYGLPQLGGVGCAWATVILTWLILLLMLANLKWRSSLSRLQLFSEYARPNYHIIAKTFRLGFPIGVSIFIELSMFAGAGMLIAMFGAVEASAHAVAITIASMSFMFYMGLGQGVTIRASQFLGAGQAQPAWYCVKVGTVFNVLLSVFFASLFIVFTKPLVSLFSQDQEVIKLAAVLLLFAAAFQIADSLQVAVIYALRAYHDTSSPPKFQFIAFWLIGLPLGVTLGFYHWWPGLEGAKGLWFAMVMSLFLVSIMLIPRLRDLGRRSGLSTSVKLEHS